MWNEMKRVRDKVETLLTHKPKLRDCDNTLIAVYWAYEVGTNKLEEMSAKALLKELSTGNLPSAESIRRSRQKIQEENPELRGCKYNKRQTEAKVIKEHINN